jgi:hypothetical protein
MDSNTPFNLIIFTNETKKVCLCSATSIFLIVLFIISPLSNFFTTSLLMKIVILLILLYTIYLNNKQTQSLSHASSVINSEKLKSQLKLNIICSYVFTIFIGLLVIFVIKSFF